MLTLGFIESIQTIQARNKVAGQIVEQGKKADPPLTLSTDDARRLADDVVIVATEAGQQAANETRAELERRVAQVGTSTVASLLIASTCFGLAGLAAIVGLSTGR